MTTPEEDILKLDKKFSEKLKQVINRLPSDKKLNFQEDDDEGEKKRLSQRKEESLINLREKYAGRSFRFMARYSMVAALILVAEGRNNHEKSFLG